MGRAACNLDVISWPSSQGRESATLGVHPGVKRPGPGAERLWGASRSSESHPDDWSRGPQQAG